MPLQKVAGSFILSSTTGAEIIQKTEPDNEPTARMIQAVLEAKEAKVANARYRDASVLPRSCPDCGSDVICVYGDFSGPDYYDHFTHYCSHASCGYHLIKQQQECNMGGGRGTPPINRCVHCGRAIEMTN